MDNSTKNHSGFITRALVKSHLDFSRNGVIKLNENLWGNPENPDFLINRHFEVGKKIADDFIAEKSTTFLLAGSKGIGKSCLGLVVVSTLLTETRFVLQVW